MNEEEEEDRILAKQCLEFKGFTCTNKECINIICPLHIEFNGAKK